MRFDAAAAEELAAATRWYHSKRPALVHQFLNAVDEALGRLARPLAPLMAVPATWAGLGAKSLRIRGFPYQLVVVSEPEGYCIVAVALYARQPGYWRDRVAIDTER